MYYACVQPFCFQPGDLGTLFYYCLYLHDFFCS